MSLPLPPALPSDSAGAGPEALQTGNAGVGDRLVLSVAEAADALGISDDLVYELIARGQLPCLRFGRRKVIPRRAIELVIEKAMDEFDPQLVLANLSVDADDVSPRHRRPSGVEFPPSASPATA